MLTLELVEWAKAYGQTQPDTFAGAWSGFEGEHAVCFASFTADREAHRAALDPRIRIVAASATAVELEAVKHDALAFVVDHDDMVLHWHHIDPSENRLELWAETPEPAAVSAELEARFGRLVVLELVTYKTMQCAFERWSVDPTGMVLTVKWIGGGGERNHRLELDERAASVTATIVYEQYQGTVTALGERTEVSATLSEPLGNRAVIDGSKRAWSAG